jgi:dTDP-glucose pyrophosphorylase
MTGQNRYKSEEYFYPKPLITINGKLMIEQSIEKIASIPDVKVIPIISREDAVEHRLDSVLQQVLLDVKHKILVLDNQTAGALCTCLMVTDILDLDEELIVVNYDQNLDVDSEHVIEYFRKNQADFGVICFQSVHPKWSFVKLNNNGMIVESAEKKPISKNAIAGFYYFKTASIFIDAAKNVLLTSSGQKESYYISESLNQCVLQGLKGLVYEIDSKKYKNFYDSNELKDFVTQSRGNLINDSVESGTARYIAAFDSQNLTEIESLLVESSILYDPNVGEICGKNNIVEFLSTLFQRGVINFVAKTVITNDTSSCIEFLLTMDGAIIRGADVITWQSGKISKIHAYLESQ